MTGNFYKCFTQYYICMNFPSLQILLKHLYMGAQNLISYPFLGWWKYDPRTSNDLETIYKLGETQCELLICGMLYVIDFANKCQYRKNNPRYKRNIKRDRKDAPCKGISGVQ